MLTNFGFSLHLTEVVCHRAVFKKGAVHGIFWVCLGKVIGRSLVDLISSVKFLTDFNWLCYYAYTFFIFKPTIRSLFYCVLKMGNPQRNGGITNRQSKYCCPHEMTVLCRPLSWLQMWNKPAIITSLSCSMRFIWSGDISQRCEQTHFIGRKNYLYEDMLTWWTEDTSIKIGMHRSNFFSHDTDTCYRVSNWCQCSINKLYASLCERDRDHSFMCRATHQARHKHCFSDCQTKCNKYT